MNNYRNSYMVVPKMRMFEMYHSPVNVQKRAHGKFILYTMITIMSYSIFFILNIIRIHINHSLIHFTSAVSMFDDKFS